MKKHSIIPIFVPHEGCPHTCVFCSQTDITGEQEGMDGARVEKIISRDLETIGLHGDRFVEVGFFGGSFTGIPIKKQQELLAPALEAKLKGRIQEIRLSTRPDYISPEILHLLHQHSVDTVEIGAQSFSAPVLAAAERGHSAGQVRKASELIRLSGFKLGIQLMVGLPEDTYPNWIYSVIEAIRCKPDLVRIYPTLVLVNTKLEEMMVRGEYQPLTLAEAVEWCRDGLALFKRNNIPVIRLGLQPTDEISPNAKVVAGPYHPAIRQLVESNLLVGLIQKALGKVYHEIQGEFIQIGMPVREESYFRGQKNANIRILENHTGGHVAMVKDESLDKGFFWVQGSGEKHYFALDDLLPDWLKGRNLSACVIQ